MNRLNVSLAPFKRQPNFMYTGSLMWILALLPACVCGLLFLDMNALITFAAVFLTYMILESTYILILKQPFMVCFLRGLPYGLIIGMIMPPYVSMYVPILCAIFAFVVKVFLGDDNGLIVNKVAIGVVIALTIIGYAVFNNGMVAVTPSEVLRGGELPTQSIVDLLLGNKIAGFIGTSVILCILFGGILLMVSRQVNFRVPLTSIVAFALMVLVIEGYEYILPELMSGAVLFVFFFMATDYYTCPNNGIGGYIYGLLLGVITAYFKIKFVFLGEYTALFALLISNLFVAMLDKFQPKYFGEVR